MKKCLKLLPVLLLSALLDVYKRQDVHNNGGHDSQNDGS